MATARLVWGPWEPDAIGQSSSSGIVRLRDASNVLWSRGGYRPWPKPKAFGTAAESPTAAYMTGDAIFVLNETSAQVSTDQGESWTVRGSGFDGGAWDFAEYGDCVYATNGVTAIQAAKRDGSADFNGVSATAPVAKVLGVIRDFLVAGNIQSSPTEAPALPNCVQWSALAQPTVWDTVGTQAARADQSGAQTLPPAYGAITYIADGESMGLVFQERGITRVQYVGGDVVFSFYTFERKHGAIHGNACAQAGNTVYFLAGDGFYATDGSQVEALGYGQVNDWFASDCTDTDSVRCALDANHQCVMWSYTAGSATHQIAYNLAERKWTHANHAVALLFQGLSHDKATPWALDDHHELNAFNGDAGQADLSTDDLRLAQGRHSLLTAGRLWSDAQSWTLGASARNAASDAVTYTGYTVPEVDGRVSLRQDGILHVVNARITGDFHRVDGLTLTYTPRGRR